MRGLMIDIETLATTPDAIVTQVAVVGFNLQTGALTNHSYRDGFSVKEQLNLNREFSDDAFLWLLNQKEATLDSIANTIQANQSTDLRTKMLDLGHYINGCLHEGVTEVWARGISFDIPILESLWNRFDIAVPWDYYQLRDLRTFCELLGVKKDDVRVDTEFVPEAPHSALYDCHWQINQYKACLDKIESTTGSTLEEIRNATSAE